MKLVAKLFSYFLVSVHLRFCLFCFCVFYLQLLENWNINMSTVAKNKDSKPEPVAYSEAALRNNAAVVEYCRTSMAALSGSTAGVLGLTGLNGFAFYVFAVIILWVMFMIHAGPKWSKYHVSRQSLLTNGFFGALFTYVLFWTFIYGMVHVY